MAAELTIKRLEGEVKSLKNNKERYYQVLQDEKDELIFYFLFTTDEKPYVGGYYIGKILLPKNYPENPGDIMMLTPSGRFMINSKICLSNTGYHRNTHSPIWTIEKIVVGFISIFYDNKEHGISHINSGNIKKKEYAENSFNYNIINNYDLMIKFDQFVNSDGTQKSEDDIDLIIEEHRKIIAMKREKRAKKEEKLKAKKAKKLAKIAAHEKKLANITAHEEK
jgi:ubiquitin-conjugating enzyme E2 J2